MVMLSECIGSSRHSTVEALLDAFNAAAAGADLASYFGCFLSQDCRFLGTDASENWSAADFYEFAKPHFEKGSAWTYVPIAGSRKCAAPVSGMVVFDELLESLSFPCTCRGSGTAVLDQTAGSWFIAQYHLTFGVPNDMAGAVCGAIGNFERRGSGRGAAAVTAAAAEEELLRLLDMESSSAAATKTKAKGTKKK